MTPSPHSRRARGLAWAGMAAAIAAALTAGDAGADTIRFKSGSVIQGKVVRETDFYIRIRLAGSGVEIQYRRADISQIEPDDKPTDQLDKVLLAGRLDEAAAICERHLAEGATPAAKELGWFGLTRVSVLRGRFADAEISFVSLLREVPGTKYYPYMPLPEGQVQDEASLLGFLEEQIKHRQDNPFLRDVVRLLAAAIHVAGGRLEQAAPHWTAARDSHDSRVHEMAAIVEAYALAQQGKRSEAAILLRRAVWKCSPVARPVLFYRLGLLEHAAGRHEQAAAALLRLRMVYEPPMEVRGQALLVAAKSFDSLGRRQDALEIYDELSQNSGQLPYARQARERALKLRGPQ